MAGRFGDINLTKYDDLFKDEETRQAEKQEQVLEVPADQIFPYARQPYTIDRPTPDLVRLMDSVERFGIMEPKYGLERGMFVLSCSIAQREGDGRFYPPARQATARFAHYRKRHEGFEISNYTNDVHSGVINLAMESLLKMELSQKREQHLSRKEQRIER